MSGNNWTEQQFEAHGGCSLCWEFHQGRPCPKGERPAPPLLPVRVPPKDCRESVLLECVRALADREGWLVYHTHDSRRSDPGFPDLVLVHPTRGLLFRELKRSGAKPSSEQDYWLDTLCEAGADAGAWWPEDWDEIVETLTARGAGED